MTGSRELATLLAGRFAAVTASLQRGIAYPAFGAHRLIPLVAHTTLPGFHPAASPLQFDWPERNY